MRTLLAPLFLVGVLACSDRDPAPQRANSARPFDAIAASCRGKELGCPRPIFPVRDLKASLAYYRDALGFKIDWEWGEPPDFASVSRGDMTVFLGQEAHADGSALWVFTKHVDRLHQELTKRKAIIKMPPTNMPWGAREMHVVDRDGNLIRFGGPEKK